MSESHNMSEEDMIEEQKHFQKVLNAFKFYKYYCLKRVVLSEKAFRLLPIEHQNLLPDFIPHLRQIRTCVEHNYEIIKLIISDTDQLFENQSYNDQEDLVAELASLEAPADCSLSSADSRKHNHSNGHGHSQGHGHSYSYSHNHACGVSSVQSMGRGQNYTDDMKSAAQCNDENNETNVASLNISTSIDSDVEINNLNKNKTSVRTPEGCTDFDMDKVKTTVKQFFRDWSSQGQKERDACYKPVIDEIQTRLPLENWEEEVKVLVPGAGLGRLAFELARLGYACQGNEFSFFMLLASNFVLNRCRETNLFTLYPWVHQFCNNKAAADQIESITFPDINPSDLPPNSNFSMAAGDFLEVYTEPNSWSCIASVFFLDTAHNIIAYLERMFDILIPGGYLINFGPLLYHFADMPNDLSIELGYTELRQVIEKTGFHILKESFMPATYIQNPKSMLKYEYDCIFFVAQKPNTS